MSPCSRPSRLQIYISIHIHPLCEFRNTVYGGRVEKCYVRLRGKLTKTAFELSNSYGYFSTGTTQRVSCKPKASLYMMTINRWNRFTFLIITFIFTFHLNTQTLHGVFILNVSMKFHDKHTKLLKQFHTHKTSFLENLFRFLLLKNN